MNNFNNLKAAIMSMVGSLKPAKYPKTSIPKALNDEVSKRQKTKKGAVHKQGKHFLGRRLLKAPISMLYPSYPGKQVDVLLTPAQYRRFHLGINLKKASG